MNPPLPPPMRHSPPARHELEDFRARYERHMKRWKEEGDRAAMLRLLRNHDVASYFCKGHTDLEPYALWHGDLVGIYDIVFVTMDPSDPTAAGAASISRAVPKGTLTLTSKWTSHSRRCVYGTIQHVAATYSGRGDEREEGRLQELTIEFRQAPVTLQGNTKFVVTKINDQQLPEDDSKSNLVTSYGILTRPGTLGWTPIETKLEHPEDQDYIHFMQHQVAQRYYGHYHWQERHSWLCQHMGMPFEAALAIHAFNYHDLPPPSWAWQPGDLVLSIQLDSAKSCTSIYFARPRDPHRLLRKLRDRYPHVMATTDSEESDGEETNSDNESTDGNGSKDDDKALAVSHKRQKYE